MHDVNQALEAIRQRSGLAGLQFDRNEAVELVFDDKISINIVRIDDMHLEFVSYLALPDFSVDTGPLRALLHANYLGAASGGGRLALDPRDDELLYCERIDVAGLSEEALEKRLIGFVEHVQFWRAPEAKGLLGPMGDKPTTLVEADFIIRG
jgi:hypothetical protein